MKEININIEGYNVNGICVGCLNYNRRMFYHPTVKECFRLLGNIDVPDGLEIQVCWECIARVKSAIDFKDQILRSYDILIKYSREHTFLDNPNDFIPYAAGNISQTPVVAYECIQDAEFDTDDDEKGVEIKEEDIEDKYTLEVPVKDETYEDQYYQDLPAVENDMTSDEDIQLSQIKEIESGKVKKKRKSERQKETEGDREASPTPVKTKKEKLADKNSRKLKNLPEELVELYTMSAEEMWGIRIEDLNSKEFQKIKYRCDDCIIAFNTEKLMHDHLNGRHQPKSEDCHQCSICQAYFLTKDNVAGHSALHLQSYRCKECGFYTTLKRRMLKHVSSHAPSAHTCSSCGTSFTTKSKLTYHRGICRQEKPQCDCCGKVFANKMTLKYHLNKILPQNKDNKPKEKLFIPCKGCDKIFHSKKSYRAHVVIHSGLTYPCPICGKLFQWKRNLARHTRNHREREQGNLHECRACGKTFASRDCYNNHMRLSKKHVSQDSYQEQGNLHECRACGKTLASRDCYNNHMRLSKKHVPQDSYQHECNYCGKKYATKWCLTDHIDWDHLKIIKYQCSFCFKAFKTAKILVAHVNNIHEGKKKEAEGEHLCEICGKSYRTVKRLKGHVWAMHTKRSNSKIFKCKLCPATFMWQTSVYKHMKMMHENNKKTKPQRAVQPVKKEEPYPGIELANRVQYFQQNIGGNLNIVHIQPIGIPQNIV